MLLLGTEQDLVITVHYKRDDGSSGETKFWPEHGQIFMEDIRGFRDSISPESFLNRMRAVFDAFTGQNRVRSRLKVQQMATKVMDIVYRARQQQAKLDSGPTRQVFGPQPLNAADRAVILTSTESKITAGG